MLSAIQSLRFAAALLIAVPLCASARAQCQTAALTGSDAPLGLDFHSGFFLTEIGPALATDGDLMAVGRNGNGVLLFRRSGLIWAEEAQFVTTPATTPYTVAAGGDHVVTGSPLQGTLPIMAGAITVFEHSGGAWTEVATLVSGDSSHCQRFGNSVSIDGDTIAVGAPATYIHFCPGAPGRVHVFVGGGSTWDPEQVVIPLDGTDKDSFGYSVRVQGDRMVVGDPRISTTDQGRAYVFERSAKTWSQVAVLVPDDAPIPDAFGQVVDLDGDTIVVSAPEWDVASTGAVYVFVRDAGVWTQQQKLVGAGIAPGERFGVAVDLVGDRIVAGAYLDGASGSARVFERSGSVWTEVSALSPAGLPGGEEFGASVALAGTAVIGLDGGYSPFPPPASGGFAYAFEPSLPAASFGVFGAGLAGTGGIVPRIQGFGCPALGQPFALRVIRSLGGAQGSFIAGTSETALPLLGGSLFVGDVFLEVAHVTGGTPGVAGEGTYTYFESVPNDPALIGVVVHLQGGYLDTEAPAGVSLTGGLRMSIQ